MSLAFVLSSLFAAILVFRYLYMSYLAQNWMTACVAYIAVISHETEWTPEEKLAKILDCGACWPMVQMMSHFWIWDFRRFIINAVEMRKILDFYAARSRVEGNEQDL